MNNPISKIKKQFRNLLNKTIEYNIIRQNLINNALTKKESGVDENSPLIVSLTTYGKYINDVYIVIESLLEQTVKPKKIVLWISDKTEDTDIPAVLKLQEQRGLEIKKTKDIRSYKKLIPTLKEFPDNPIITFDDDCIYPFDAIESLYKNYCKDQNKIFCRVARKMKIKSKNSFMPYKTFPKEYIKEESNLVFPVGCGGTLYPPHCFDTEVFDEKTFQEICPLADDIWFKAMSLKNSVQSVCVQLNKEPYIDLDIFMQNQNGRLNASNVDKNKNDIQLAAVWNKFNLWNKM